MSKNININIMPILLRIYFLLFEIYYENPKVFILVMLLNKLSQSINYIKKQDETIKET